MKVSVIVPVYNTEAYLEQCLNSLVCQTLPDMEILVVDDGSTDSSLRIAQRFEKMHPNKVRVFSKENGGLSSARNFAMPYAQGEYLGFVDSDDWVEPTMYEEMYNTAVAEDAEIAICDLVDVYPTRSIYHHSSKFENKFMVTASACNKIFRRSLIGDDDFPVGLWYEDLHFTTRQLMKTEKIAAIHKGFYNCHCRESSIMNNNNSLKNLDILTVLEHLEQFVAAHDWQAKYGTVLEYLYLDHVLITSVNRVAAHTGKEKQEVLRTMVRTMKAKYPRYYRDEVFRRMPRNRKIVALLNSMGLWKISQLLINIKRK